MKTKIFSILLLAFIFASCTGSKADETLHEHEVVKIQLTAYTNDFELFAEAHPFVVGQTSNVLSHFSKLPSFEALNSGSITVSLSINGKEVSQTLDGPTRKGIYSFKLEAQTEGIGELIFDISNEKGNFRVVVPNVRVFRNKHDAIHAAEDAEISSVNSISFTKEQSWKIAFATELPTNEPFGQIIKTTAQVQSAQGDEIMVSANTNGIVSFSSDNVLEGKSVSNKQVLFSISGSGLSDNNSAVRYAEAKNNYEKTKLDYERARELAEDKIVSEKDLSNAKNHFDNSKVVYENLNKNFSATGQSVSCSMNGFVKHIYVQNGQYVEAGQAIVCVSQNKTLLLRAEVQQKYASILGSILSANIRTLHDNKTYTMEQLNGKVLSYGRNTNTDNYLIPVSLQIDNKGNFITGGFVELYLKTMTNLNALTIPNSSLIEEQGNYFVYVQITPELFEKREIKPGASDGIKTEVLSGLSKTERIVSRGAVIIKLAQATGTLDAHSGHVH